MVEFALTLPLVLLLALSVLDYGYYMEHLNNISTVVRDGARFASEFTGNSPWGSFCPDPVSSAGVYSCPLSTDPSDKVESLIQMESESLTVPEGGLPLDNIDCCWGGAGGGSGCPSGSGTTVPSTFGATAQIPTGWPTSTWPSGITVTDAAPLSCMSITYWTSSPQDYQSSHLSLCGYWSADANNYAGAFVSVGSSGTCTPAAGQLVQVTVMYKWSQVAPGPSFVILNSVFGLSVTAQQTYSFVVTA
ncbi:MAG TPA: TadE/TadG family type IV pilus assembly protein [Candidatus Binatia bacterium]|nr:TadE/TadG family type IV pilus assembly protein [Candidatus Binatia bacterium]